eukprot:GGOE01044505.1.p3 GENE.GGOE01044505.1~~GGOE01044505.1.p3  ORF type:complete len:133 (+),score=5.78 GGOE01044505.1:343-741(+)
MDCRSLGSAFPIVERPSVDECGKLSASSHFNPQLSIAEDNAIRHGLPVLHNNLLRNPSEVCSPAFSDGSDDWFDRVESSICLDCQEPFTSRQFCHITNHPHTVGGSSTKDANFKPIPTTSQNLQSQLPSCET